MFSVFKKYLGEKITLTDEEYTLIESVSIIKKLRKHQYLLQEGSPWLYKAFVCSGCLRSYQVDDKGVEHILYFATENWWAGDPESSLSGNPSKSNIDAIEDSVILLFTSENFQLLENKIPVFKDLINTLITRSFIVSQNRVHASNTQTADERYFNFIEKYPQFASRVPQHMIASYLGISAETLSRIRKQAVRK